MKNRTFPPFCSFGDKLNATMNLVELSNIRLSRYVNVDPSHISRFRNGLRTPKSNPELVDKICQALLEQIIFHDQLSVLLDMTGISEENAASEDLLFVHFRNWLCDFEPNDSSAIHDLLSTVENFTLKDRPDLPSPEQVLTKDILTDDRQTYVGKDGLQSAVLRFLGQVIQSHATEIYLYSDEDMRWMMEPEFHAKWAALMVGCVCHGTHIKIIHNIDRNVTEMIDAIKSWLPLYMSGRIEPYYSTQKSGNRFTHTLFLCPDVAYINSCNAHGSDNNSLYEYNTDALHLNFAKQNYENMLQNSHVLVRTLHLDTLSGHETKEELPNISIQINPSSVTVIRNIEPYTSFVFYHPLMCKAFANFVREKRIQE